jgi:hypothetical protein
MTRSLKALFLVLCLSLILCGFSSAQVVLTNNNGDFVSTGQTSGTLSLNGSTLIGIQGLAGYGIPNNSVSPPASLGGLTLTTAAMSSGGNILTGASFGAGGNIMFTYSNGVTFTGSFTTASFNPASFAPNTWIFSGTIMNGTLTVPGYAPAVVTNAVTVDLTTVGATPTCTAGGGCTFVDSQGTTNFTPPALSPVPELGSLTLLGSGLVCVGVLARRQRSRTNGSVNQ